MSLPLEGIRILDLSRVLAGPVCTQILGDLGADIIKIERPSQGDDTRKWGPPFMAGENGEETNESAYYLSCNRNKRSVTIDIAKPEGQELIRRILTKSDVLIENFKVGGLEKYGLGYNDLKKDFPALVYCSISGFGQNGPLAHEPGYDFLAQALGGLMANTGTPNGEPIKAGVALSDVMTGLYSTIGILTALHSRKETGNGQRVDLSLLDVTLAGMTNIAQYYLTSGRNAPRQGNAHATIVPYQSFKTQDGHVVIAIGNNGQFEKFCAFLGQASWAEDPLFSTNAARVKNRERLVPMIGDIVAKKPTEHWVNALRDVDIPVAPVNTISQTFDMEQIQARDMKISMNHSLSGENISLVGSPLKLSETPVSYRQAPPTLGQHTREVLKEILHMEEADMDTLENQGVI